MTGSQIRGSSRDGFTVVEMAVALAVFGLVAGAMASGVQRGASFSSVALKVAANDDGARAPIKTLTDVVTEGSYSSFDTSTRVFVRGWGEGPSSSGFESDRFAIPGVPLRQCSSPVCEFHTNRTTFALRMRGYHCGFEFRTGMGLQSDLRGKNWPLEAGDCPLDRSSLTGSSILDGMKFFTPRGPDGSFAVSEGGIPVAQQSHLVFIFPYRSDSGDQVELRQYIVSVADLIPSVNYSQGWDAWNPTAPSMIDLFDFGTDGTSDGAPDGSVPVTSATSDADTEAFVVMEWEGEPSICIYKVLGSQQSFPYREVVLRVRMRDGHTMFTAKHHESGGESWIANATFDRTPRTLVSNVTDFVVSTKRSHPFDQDSNPSGVDDAGVVRVCLGTTQRAETQGVVSWPYRVDRLSLRPRNN